MRFDWKKLNRQQVGAFSSVGCGEVRTASFEELAVITKL